MKKVGVLVIVVILVVSSLMVLLPKGVTGVKYGPAIHKYFFIRYIRK
jgi:hypothetical protein